MYNHPMNTIINFSEEDAYPHAREEFIRMCGFKPDSVKHEKMLNSAMKIRSLGMDKLNIQALISVFEPDVLGENFIEINGVRLHCDSVYMMEKEKIHKVLFYILTVDECGCASEDILDRIYADFWGTAYVDAAFRLFLKDVGARCTTGAGTKLTLSEAFGPGYYGMPTEEMKTIFMILDGNKIGVKCLESNVMTPIKSCTGLLFAIEEGAKMPEISCKYCLGNKSGCRYCSVYSGRS